MLQTIATFVGMGHSLKRLAYAQTLEEQQQVWNSNWLVRFCKQGNSWLVKMGVQFLALIFLNRFVLWYVLQLHACNGCLELSKQALARRLPAASINLFLVYRGTAEHHTCHQPLISLWHHGFLFGLDNEGPASCRCICVCLWSYP